MPETQQRSEARPPMGFPFLTADDQPLFAARAKGVARCSRDALSGRLWPTPGTDYRRNGPVNAQLPLQCSQLANGSQVAYGAEVKTSPASIRDGLGSRHEQRPSIGGWRTADTATRPARPLQSGSRHIGFQGRGGAAALPPLRKTGFPSFICTVSVGRCLSRTAAAIR